MNSNDSHLKSLPRFKLTVSLFMFLGLVIFTWLISIALAPLYKSNQIRNFIKTDSAIANHSKSVYFNPEMAALAREKAYKEALLKLSEYDSIHLVVNLADSTVNLSINGMVIHQTKIKEFTKDKFIDRLSLPQEIMLFSQPLLLKSQFATIVKEPIVVRQAPKDTLEASLNAWAPDTLIQNPAFVWLLFEHDIQLILEQEDIKTTYDRRKKIGFYNHLRREKIMLSASRFFSFKEQLYSPEIIIKMPVEDLRAIYRALPIDAYIVIKL